MPVWHALKSVDIVLFSVLAHGRALASAQRGPVAAMAAVWPAARRAARESCATPPCDSLCVARCSAGGTACRVSRYDSRSSAASAIASQWQARVTSLCHRATTRPTRRGHEPWHRRILTTSAVVNAIARNVGYGGECSMLVATPRTSSPTERCNSPVPALQPACASVDLPSSTGQAEQLEPRAAAAPAHHSGRARQAQRRVFSST